MAFVKIAKLAAFWRSVRRFSKQKEQPILLKYCIFANVSALNWCHYQRLNATVSFTLCHC